MRGVRRYRWIALAAVVGVSATACANDSTTIDDSTVTVFGPYVGADANHFAEVIDDFETETGIDVAYTGSANFVSDLRTRALGNQRPDVAMVPQPGVVEALVDDSVLVPLGVEVVLAVRDGFGSADLAASPWDLRYSVPYRSNTKSLVWYRPEIFAEHGWDEPATLADLPLLVDEITAEGEMAPWCFSVFAGSATGWPATDWVEDLVLRDAGADIYDQWAAGELSWQSPEIRGAFTAFRELVVDPGRSAGGLRAILQTQVADASAPLFAESPGCAMYKQASFAENWFPSGTMIGPDADVDYFALPSGVAGETDLVIAGDAAVSFSDRPNVDRFMAFLASAEGGSAWADDGGFVSQRADVDVEEYYDEVDAGFAALLQNPTNARFDASDTLPAEVGSDLLWKQITAWLNGSLTLDEFLVSIDEALGIES